MLQPPGFSQYSVMSSLGTLVYYGADEASTFTQISGTQTSGEMVVGKKKQTPLVFLHGFGGGSSAYEWSMVYPAFLPNYSVIAPDLLGWGRSEHLTRSYQIQDYLTTIADFLEKVCSTAAVVIASSLTAALIVRLAVLRPELFRALILVAPSGLSDFGKPYSSFFSQLVSFPGIDRLIYSTGIASSTGIRNFLEKRQFARASRVSQEMVDAYLSSAQQPHAEYSAISFVRGDLCFDLADHMPQLTIPTALIWGKQAQFTPAELGQRFVELNPQLLKLALINDVGLTPQLELPAVTIGIIHHYLQHFAVP
jgi:pimeloyl-ACP methyl ester carboxylesterase